MLTHSLKELGL